MTVLHTLWLPILLSSVFVFLASSIVHMALPWHKNDFKKLPGEDKALDALRPLGIPPGDYMAPRCGERAEMKTPEFAEKLRKGPVMVLTVMPNGPFTMGRSLLLWFLYLILVSALSALGALHALPVGAGYHRVFHVIGILSFLGYAGALWQSVIWYRTSCGTAFKNTVDALIYAGLTAGTFGWLWPR
jgi:hypothetical protein